LWTVIFSKWPRCWNQVEYNRRAAIINHQRPSRSSIIFWISEINRLWCCDKIYSFKTIQRRYLYATEEESLEKSIARTPAVIESANFEWSKAIVAKISIDCWCKRANNALARLHCRWRLPSIQIVHIKDITDALWGCQDKTSCSPRLPFWPPNSPDLNPLDYYVWSVIERITNKSLHPNVTSLRTAIEAAFVGMDSATLQRACDCFRPRIEAVIQANGDVSNNCALQGSPKCHIKGFFVIFNFSLKIFCLKKLFGFWWRTL